MKCITDYFPQLSKQQQIQFAQLDELYREWNAAINVISRKDIDNLYKHHVLHSLSIAKAITFAPGSRILDLGTGGGFPGIPLAILFPNVSFILIDGRGKKIKVVQEVSDAIGLRNLEAHHCRAEEWRGVSFDFIVTRAVASAAKLYEWSRPLISQQQQNAYPNGLWALKGGMLREELSELPRGIYRERIPLSRFFDDPFFEEKQLLYLQC